MFLGLSDKRQYHSVNEMMIGQYSRAQGNTNGSIAGKSANILDVKFRQI